MILESEFLESIGVPSMSHDKLPDVVVFDEKRNWLFLIEAVTSHGPVSPKRWVELEEVLATCKVGRVYVTAFPNRAEFRKNAADIAWETEVWIADNPDHMIHFNGDRFLGPHEH
jgi:adenine-specific DNA-methyltransferase